MLIRCGFLLISEANDAASDDEALTDVQALLAGVLDGFLPLASRIYAAPPRYQMEESLRQWCDEEELDLIVTVGGTFPAPGPSAWEIVPEATAAVLERSMPSLSETMRARAAATHPQALLDRGVAGIRGRTLIVNLPGGRGLAAAFLESILDLIPSIVARLAAEDELPAAEVLPIPSAQENDQPRSGALNQDEFAAFLQRRQKGG
jgi:molybdopterin adenylyltransferase